MSEVLFGPDLSHYQAGIDIARIASDGSSFIIGKISQGTGYRDLNWPTVRDHGRVAGLVVIGYHYITGDPPAAQAALCASYIGDKAIPVALDWESGGGNFAHLVSVLAAFRAAGLNVRLLYTGAWYWAQVGSPDMRSLGLPLWSSHYPSAAGGSPTALYQNVGPAHWAGYGGLSTALLQFTDRATIAGRAVDCSAFAGTRDELIALLTPGGDDVTPDQAQQLADIHDRVCRLETAWAGGGTDANDTPYDMRLFISRINVEVHQALLAVEALTAKVDALIGHGALAGRVHTDPFR